MAEGNNYLACLLGPSLEVWQFRDSLRHLVVEVTVLSWDSGRNLNTSPLAAGRPWFVPVFTRTW